jgi:gamma-glutamyltranspeptidase / glutathione hydrolase
VQVVAGIRDEGLTPAEAVARPRLHPVDRLVHVEPDIGEEVVQALEEQGLEVREWPERHHYFGGVSVVARSGAAGDPRRSGAAAPVRLH